MQCPNCNSSKTLYKVSLLSYFDIATNKTTEFHNHCNNVKRMWGHSTAVT